MPLFSVLIPLYNKQNHIYSTLKSVLGQTFTDFEVIVADDGSTDRSALIVAAFKDTRIKYFRKENGGAASARNFAMQNACGEYFAFLDADDYWYTDHLQEIHKAIHTIQHLNVFASLLEVENKYGIYQPDYTSLTNNKLQEADFFKFSLRRAILSGSTTVIHKEVYRAIGEFDTSIVSCEDTDYWIRIGFFYKIGVINKVTARHNYVADSLTHNRSKAWNATFFEKFTNLEKTNAAAKKMIDINRYALALRCKITGDTASYKKFLSLISPMSLSAKERLLLKLPGWLLSLLLHINNASKAR